MFQRSDRNGMHFTGASDVHRGVSLILENGQTMYSQTACQEHRREKLKREAGLDEVVEWALMMKV